MAYKNHEQPTPALPSGALDAPLTAQNTGFCASLAQLLRACWRFLIRRRFRFYLSHHFDKDRRNKVHGGAQKSLFRWRRDYVVIAPMCCVAKGGEEQQPAFQKCCNHWITVERSYDVIDVSFVDGLKGEF